MTEPEEGRELASPQAREAVCSAFALGWQMSRLFASPIGTASEQPLETDLPGLAALSSHELIELGLDQVDAGLNRLGPFLRQSGVLLPGSDGVRALMATPPVDRSAVRQAILDLHVDLLTKLMAADFRCGKAYGLGRALGDTCAPSQEAESLAHHLDRHRASEIGGWLDDLSSLLPDHAGKAVERSFAAWIDWAEAHPLGVAGGRDVQMTSQALHAQGQRWRALLSGEKDAKDVLTLDDYPLVAERSLARTSALTRQIVWRLWLPLLLALALLGLGIALVVEVNSAAQVVAGLGAMAISLGLSWRGVTVLLGRLGARLEGPVWGAQFDAVVAERITRLPSFTAPAPPEPAPRTLVMRAPPEEPVPETPRSETTVGRTFEPEYEPTGSLPGEEGTSEDFEGIVRVYAEDHDDVDDGENTLELRLLGPPRPGPPLDRG